MKEQCWNEAQVFTADRLKNHIEFWKTITSDPAVLQIVQGLKIEIENEVTQRFVPPQIKFGKVENEQIEKEILNMLRYGIITKIPLEPEEGEFLSNIFIRPKKPDGVRVILNLKKFNENVKYRHFKMENLHTAIALMTRNAFMASIDFKQAYYCVGIHKPHRKYVRFIFNGCKYEYTSLPNGLSSGPREFTKLMKVLFKSLREKSFQNSSYIDDSFLIEKSKFECFENVLQTVETSRKAGFVIHPEKSQFIPVQVLEYLGFILNTLNMTVRLTKEKVRALKQLIVEIISVNKITIELLAKLVGKLVATFPGVSHGKLYYRQLDIEKSEALHRHKGNYKAVVLLSSKAKSDLKWWHEHLDTEFVDVRVKTPDKEVFADASDIGWGGHIGNQNTGGKWSEHENSLHINEKELLAVLYSLKSLCSDLRNETIKVVSDNTTCVNYINGQGGRKQKCYDITRDIWEWAICNHIWLIAVHLPGKLNVRADMLSRKLRGNKEWKLDSTIFQKINDRFGPSNFDLFASRINNQLNRFASWLPDPEAELCDSMAFDWKTVEGYAFPPFSMIGKVLKKVESDRCQIVIVVPEWTGHFWFPKLLEMLIDYPLYVPPRGRRLTNPDPKEESIKATLLVCKISGCSYSTQEFRTRLERLSSTAGGLLQGNSTRHIYASLKTFVVKGIVIPCQLI